LGPRLGPGNGRIHTTPVFQAWEGGGVDQSHVIWVKYDSAGRTVRNGPNFTEGGFGVRAAVGC
jgi:hypothetical protein